MRKRGWTDAAIQRFLPEPDKRKPNPRFKNASPMQLWKRSRVEKIEASQPWYQWVAQSRRRSQSAQRTADEQKQQLLDEVAQPAPARQKTQFEQLRHDAWEHYNTMRSQEEPERLVCSEISPGATQSDSDEMDRITINYLWHQLSCYGEAMDFLTEKSGANDALQILRYLGLKSFANAYPHLRKECERQMLQCSWRPGEEPEEPRSEAISGAGLTTLPEAKQPEVQTFQDILARCDERGGDLPNLMSDDEQERKDAQWLIDMRHTLVTLDENGEMRFLPH